MAHQTEYELETQFVDYCTLKGWFPVSIPNYDALLLNFRDQLNKLNEDNLESSVLTDSEFTQVLTQIEGKGVYTSAKLLRDKIVIKRGSNDLYLTLFDKTDISRNSYQVSRQTETHFRGKHNRLDVTLLINGLPVVQVELKQTGKGIREAYNQVNRYRKESFHRLYNFLQFFVVSDGVETKYFANSEADTIPFNQAFYWADQENTRITNLFDFTKAFLTSFKVARTLTHFMVVKEETKSLMILRPYQVHAIDKSVSHAVNTTENGHIWAATGSGKTLTSFLVAKTLAEKEKFSKVLFIVDRRDLDAQTITEFNSFQAGSVEENANSGDLADKLADPNQKIIVTTIHKISNLAKADHVSLQHLKDKPVVFIVDECHRSQFGEMTKHLRKTFSLGQYIGFTGTPIFEENRNANEQTTASVFGSLLHTYKTIDAIEDGNVLPYIVEHMNTFKENNTFSDALVEGINSHELLYSPVRMGLIADDIAAEYSKKTLDYTYNAMFAVSTIQSAVVYYDLLRQRMPNSKITVIFSAADNEDQHGLTETSKASLNRVMSEYNTMFKTNMDDKDDFFADVQKRMKRRELDLVIVVEMLLTGFDSPKTNTLFMDKQAQYHKLIQMISRTNRLSGVSKKTGNIRCYRPIKDSLDKALKLYSTDNTGDVVLKTYTEALSDLNAAIDSLLGYTPTPATVDALQGDQAKADYVEHFTKVARGFNRIKPYTEYEADSSDIKMTEQSYLIYRSKYNSIRLAAETTKNRESILKEIDYHVGEVQTSMVNVDYINSLLETINLTDHTKMVEDIEFLEEAIKSTNDPDLKLKSELLSKFLNREVPTFKKGTVIKHEWDLYLASQAEKELALFAETTDSPLEEIRKIVAEFKYSDIMDNEALNQLVRDKNVGFKERRTFKQLVTEFTQAFSKKY